MGDIALESQQAKFEKLFSKKSQMIMALARNLVLTSSIRDLLEPEDLVQETLLKAWNAFGTYDSTRSQFSSWLIVIMKNLFRTKLRNYKKRVGIINVPADETEVQLYENASSPTSLIPDAQVVEDEMQESIMSVLDKLSASHKQVVIAMDVMGLTYEEAGVFLGVDLGTVKSRLNRAHRILRRDKNLFKILSS